MGRAFKPFWHQSSLLVIKIQRHRRFRGAHRVGVRGPALEFFLLKLLFKKGTGAGEGKQIKLKKKRGLKSLEIAI